jgi:hypothetical protein
MIRKFAGEKWNDLDLVSRKGVRYAISNFGRFVSYTDRFEEGILLKCGTNKGYKIHRVIITLDEKTVRKGLYIHKLVAENFLPEPQDEKTAVIHIDFNKSNNHYKNLRWVNKEELDSHQRKNPGLKEQIKRLHEHNKKSENGYKLTEAKVKILKRKLLDPNRRTRIKMLARQFGVSEMQLYRIKIGENWGHVKVDKMKP